MRVEQAYLRYRGRAYESCVLIELRTGFHAAAARDAVRQRIGLFLVIHGHARAGAEVVGSIDRYPGFDLLQVLEEYAAIDGEVSDDGKLRERLKLERLIEVVRSEEH